MDILRSQDRGTTQIDWLDSRHSFAFGRSWPDGPHARGYRSLRVINDDRVAPGAGFSEHGHENMEIISIVLAGGLSHKDSTGTSSTIRRGEVQRMTAGSGIRHSEFNPSETDPTHLLQIWLHPEREGIEPGYEAKAFGFDDEPNRFHLIASREADEGSLKIHQDARVLLGRFDEGERGSIEIEPGRGVWVHVAEGSATVQGEALEAGDGVAIDDPGTLEVIGRGGLVLVFDLT